MEVQQYTQEVRYLGHFKSSCLRYSHLGCDEGFHVFRRFLHFLHRFYLYWSCALAHGSHLRRSHLVAAVAQSPYAYSWKDVQLQQAWWNLVKCNYKTVQACL